MTAVVGTVAVTEGDTADGLLCALDELANTVHWLRQRTSFTAADALLDALADWLADHADPEIERELTDRGAGLGDAFSEFTAAVDRVAAADDTTTLADALADAILAWTAALSAEHHYSAPFQPLPVR